MQSYVLEARLAPVRQVSDDRAPRVLWRRIEDVNAIDTASEASRLDRGSFFRQRRHNPEHARTVLEPVPALSCCSVRCIGVTPKQRALGKPARGAAGTRSDGYFAVDQPRPGRNSPAPRPPRPATSR